MAELALGLDLGTSGVRVLAVDPEGRVQAEVNRSYPLYTPQPGWTEQDPADWQRESLIALKEITSQLNNHAIVALGLSGQMHGMTPLDKGGDVVRRALLWNDQRTGKAVKEINKRVPQKDMIAKTGNPAITGFHVCKLVWMRQEEPELFAKTAHSLLPKDYLGFILTGVMRSEPSDNSGTNCFNLASKTWDTDILSALELSPTLFPEVIASHGITGYLKEEWAQQTGLPRGLAVIAGAGDNAAAATGLGLSSETSSLGSVSLGTSGVIFAPLSSPTPDSEGRVHLFCHADGGYNLLGVTLSAAGSFQWYKDTLAETKSFDELVSLAEQSPVGAHGVSFKPYLAGERSPHLNPDLRGSWTGLSLATTQADMVRALLEGVSFSLRDALDIILPLSQLETALVTGGGAKSDTWLQMTADVLELSLKRLTQNQGAAYGAALLAFQGAGYTDSAASLSQAASGQTFAPENASSYSEALERYRNVPLLH